VTITVLSAMTNGTACSMVITQTWQATDCNSNSSTCSQIVTVVDTTPPVITTVAGSLDHTLECSDTAGIASAQAEAPSATGLRAALPIYLTISVVSTMAN